MRPAETPASGQPGGGPARATTPATLGEVREVGPQGPATGRSERKTADTPTPLPDVAPDLLGRVSQDRQAGHPLTSTPLRVAEESVPSESAIIQRPALERHIGGQVLERLVHTVREGKSQVTLQLHPESLGRLQLQITLEDQRLQTRIVTESPLVRDLITAQEPGLRDALRGQGLTLEGLSVQVGGRFEHPGQGAGFTPGGPRLAPQPDGAPGAVGPGEPAAISSPRALSQGRQLVDLFA
ncbi:MAG: flagellar hook-length control protein FliK [Deltaproteobacteria bacterium]|nr:flagellar hook-length control protein FliK [Deltaproteobacteria bacterium]